MHNIRVTWGHRVGKTEYGYICKNKVYVKGKTIYFNRTLVD